jgi:hypothetical protein
VAYFLAPWTALARPSDTPTVIAQVTPGGGIEWRAAQRAVEQGKVPEVIVTLSPDLEILESGVNRFFTETHALLDRPGGISGDGASWHEPAVRRWTAAQGWQDAGTRVRQGGS